MLKRLVQRVSHLPEVATQRLEERRSRQRLDAWQRIKSSAPRRLTVDSRNGRLTFDSRDSIIGRALFVDRHWEYDLIRRTTMSLRRYGLLDQSRTTLVDAGANIGSTTVAFLRDRVFEHAVAVEPDLLNYELLERNVRQNGLHGRVLCLPIALGAESGKATLELSPVNFGDHRVRVGLTPGDYDESERETRAVDVARLDDLLDREDKFGTRAVGLLWIDVQGFEGHVLQGASRILAAGTPVELEFWPYGLARAGTSKDGFLGLLKASFSSVIDLRDPELIPRSVVYVDALYETLFGPFADTELLLFNAR